MNEIFGKWTKTLRTNELNSFEWLKKTNEMDCLRTMNERNKNKFEHAHLYRERENVSISTENVRTCPSLPTGNRAKARKIKINLNPPVNKTRAKIIEWVWSVLDLKAPPLWYIREPITIICKAPLSTTTSIGDNISRHLIILEYTVMHTPKQCYHLNLANGNYVKNLPWKKDWNCKNSTILSQLRHHYQFVIGVS